MKASARHWFHCCEDFHGERWEAERVVPRWCGTGEPPVPRLCVGASVAACFAARLFGLTDVHVYRTERPRRAVRPVGVWDAIITQERWLVPPVGMVRVAVIPQAVAWAASCDTRDVLVLGRRPLTVREKFLALRAAVDTLGAFDPSFVSEFDRRFALVGLAHQWSS